MFYAHFVLSKRGPLARVWLAAHWDKKLTKAHVFETSIETSVEGILQPKVKMALRTSGHLLLGVVRIYSRKAKYLLADCNEAFVKIKMAFRPGVVDLPEDNREAAVATITLPEVFHDFDTTMPEINDIDMQAQFNMNQSRAEEITIREEFGSNPNALLGDDGFGDMGFDDPEMGRDMPQMDQLDKSGALFGDEGPSSSNRKNRENSTVTQNSNLELDAPLRDDGFGGGDGEGLLAVETSGLFEPGGLFDDAPMEQPSMENSTAEGTKAKDIPDPLNQAANQSDDDDDYYGDMGPPSMGAPSSGPSSPGSPMPGSSQPDNQTPPDGMPSSAPPMENQLPETMQPNQDPVQQQPSVPMPPPMMDQTTLVQNEDESFALAPLEQTVVHGPERTIKAKRKRKLIVDEVKNISGEEMKSQLSDTSDIVTTLDLAPPTKRLMHWKESGGVEKLFALPGHGLHSKHISKFFQRHLTTKSVENERIVLNGGDDDEGQPIPSEEQDILGEAEKQRSYEVQEQGTGTPDVAAQMDSSLKRHMDEDISGLSAQRSRLGLDDSGIPQIPPINNEPAPYIQPPPPPQSLHDNQHFMSPHPASLQDNSQFLSPPQPSTHDQSSFFQPQLPQSIPTQPMQPSNTIPQPQPVLDLFQPHHQSPLDMPSASTSIPQDSFFPPPVISQQQLLDQQQLTQQQYQQHEHQLQQQHEQQLKQQREQQLQQQLQHEQQLQQQAEQLQKQAEQLQQQQAKQLQQQQQEQLQQQNEHLQSQQPELPLEETHPQSYRDDDDDIYGAPASVGPPEEQAADETYEQYEERVINKRTAHMLSIMKTKFFHDDRIIFSDLVHNNRRKMVAQKFYTFLVLKKQQICELYQEEPFGDLIITRGTEYEKVL